MAVVVVGGAGGRSWGELTFNDSTKTLEVAFCGEEAASSKDCAAQTKWLSDLDRPLSVHSVPCVDHTQHRPEEAPERK